MGIRSGAAKRTAVASVVLGMAMSLTACSDDDDDADEPSTSPEPTATPPVEMSSRVTTGEVTGRLPKDKRRAVTDDVGEVVMTWIQAAYFSGSPRTQVDDAFPGFTDGAARLARRDRWLMSNASLAGNVEEVEPVGEVGVDVDMLAARGRVAGATARFRVVFDAVAAKTRRVTVRGRLALTRNARGSWTVFAYDAGRFAKVQKGRNS